MGLITPLLRVLSMWLLLSPVPSGLQQYQEKGLFPPTVVKYDGIQCAYQQECRVFALSCPQSPLGPAISPYCVFLCYHRKDVFKEIFWSKAEIKGE